MILSAATVSAYESYLYGKYINIGTIEFTDGKNPIAVLPQEGDVTVSARVKKRAAAEAAQQVSIIAAAYSNSELVRTAVGSVTLADAYTATVGALIDVTGADELRAYVCDSLENGRPLAKGAVFGENTALIEAITVGNEELAGFSPNKASYDIIVSAGYTVFPEITAKLSNSALRAEVDYEGKFPLAEGKTARAVLKIMSPGGAALRSYTINIRQEEAAVTNPSSSATAVSVKTGLGEPDFIEEPEGAIKTSELTEGYGYENMKNSFAKFVDRIYPFIFIPENILGSTVITTNIAYTNEYGYSNGNDTVENGISFDLNRSAMVYMLVKSYNSSWISELGFARDTAMKTYWVSQNDKQGRLFADTGYIKKYVKVEPGETVTVKTGPVAFGFVDFDDGNIVSGARLRTSESETRDLPVMDKLYNADYFTERHPEYTGQLNNYQTAVGFISDRPAYYSTEFPEELLDAEGIALPLNFRGIYSYAGDVENTDAISFDITASADVYIFYPSTIENIPWMESAGFEEIADENFKIKYVWGQNSAYTIKAFKKHYNVQPGETALIELGGFPPASGSNTPLMLIVDRAR